jgi:nucleotide-binding universal stress UspA family protein
VERGARILVGTDFSEGAALALETARGLASRLGARIEIVHVIERYGDTDWLTDGPALEWLQRLGIDRDALVVRSGFPWVELVRHAHDSPPIMIVVGSHGSSGFQPLALGSTAGRMGVLSPYPVLVVTGAAASRRTAGATAGWPT